MTAKKSIIGEVSKKYKEGEIKPRRYESEDERNIEQRIPEIATRYGGHPEMVPGVPNVPSRYKTKKPHTEIA